MDWKARAERIVRDAAEPTLLAHGFEGAFPYYHRLGRQAVECVSIQIFVRGGVRVYVMSLAHRPRLATKTAAQDAAYAGRQPPPPDARYVELRLGGMPIDSAARLKALPQTLASLDARLRDEGRAFWKQHAADVELRGLRDRASTAVLAGDLAGVRRVLASARSPRLAQDALGFTVPRWNEPKTIDRVFRVAPAIITMKPQSFTLAGVLTAGAARARGRQAEAVLAWVKPHLRKLRWLAGQIALHADLEANAKRFAPALLLYDLVVGLPDVSALSTANALWAVMADNNQLPVDRARHEHFLRRALASYPDDPIVRFNAACLRVELNQPDRALAELAAAIACGLDPARLAAEPLFERFRGNPTFAKLARAKQRTVARPPRFA